MNPTQFVGLRFDVLCTKYLETMKYEGESNASVVKRLVKDHMKRDEIESTGIRGDLHEMDEKLNRILINFEAIRDYLFPQKAPVENPFQEKRPLPNPMGSGANPLGGRS